MILTFSSQPLELDYIVVSSQEELPSVGAGFWEELKYGVQGFFASFVEDYNSIGGSADGRPRSIPRSMYGSPAAVISRRSLRA